VDFNWKPEYDKLAKQFLEQHFGDGQGLTRCFPCLRDTYPWGDHRQDVIDSRIAAKNNTEYHGLERHAKQYHATAQYEYAYHHWLLAACWRRGDMIANNFNDESHNNAVQYCLKHALYNQALYEWQQRRIRGVPQPEAFGLTARDVEHKEQKALKELEDFDAK